jgi:MoaA/NifB/PqqE/SkfB family radical SAM enzyme
LEGASAERNDEIRGRGSFEGTIQAIRNLMAEHIDVSVMMTITRNGKWGTFVQRQLLVNRAPVLTL